MLSSMYGSRGVQLVSGRLGRVVDREGREYVDWFTAHGAALFGHQDPQLVQALKGAAEGLWTVGAGFDHPSRRALEEEVERCLPGRRFFVCNSGTEAVECALKLCIALRPGRTRVIAARRAFHGRTLGALSLTFSPKYRSKFDPFLCRVEHLPPERIPEAIDDRVAAVFLEPVQGEGGVHPLDAELGRRITRAAAEHQAILVADEVQTGMGRCGRMMASHLVGLEPQVVCLAKGLAGGFPCGMVLWDRDLVDFSPGLHGSTYGGNPLACSLAALSMGRIRSGEHLEACRIMEAFRRELAGAGLDVQVRGLGTMTGVEVPVDSSGIVKSLQSAGLLALQAGPRVVRFLPSIKVTGEDAEMALDLFIRALRGAS